MKKGYKQGGKVKRAPIYVDSPNDPRYRAYQDSLALYNNYLDVTKGLNDQKYKGIPFGEPAHQLGPIVWGRREFDVNTKPEDWEKYKQNARRYPQLSGITPKENMYEVDDFITGFINKSLPRQLFSDKIQPVGLRQYAKGIGMDDPNANRMFVRDDATNTLKPLDRKQGDMRVVADYSNTQPIQEIQYIPPPPVTKSVPPKKKTVIPPPKPPIDTPQKSIPIPQKKIKYQYIREDSQGIRESDRMDQPIAPEWFNPANEDGTRKFKKGGTIGYTDAVRKPIPVQTSNTPDVSTYLTKDQIATNQRRQQELQNQQTVGQSPYDYRTPQEREYDNQRRISALEAVGKTPDGYPNKVRRLGEKLDPVAGLIEKGIDASVVYEAGLLGAKGLKALAKKVGSKVTIPRGYTGPMMTDMVPPDGPMPGSGNFPMSTINKTKGSTGMPTQVDVPTLNKEQQILQSYGVNPRDVINHKGNKYYQGPDIEHDNGISRTFYKNGEKIDRGEWKKMRSEVAKKKEYSPFVQGKEAYSSGNNIVQPNSIGPVHGEYPAISPIRDYQGPPDWHYRTGQVEDAADYTRNYQTKRPQSILDIGEGKSLGSSDGKFWEPIRQNKYGGAINTKYQNGGVAKNQWDTPYMAGAPGITDYGDMYTSADNQGLMFKPQGSYGWEGFGNPANLITNTQNTDNMYKSNKRALPSRQVAMDPSEYSIDAVRGQYGNGGFTQKKGMYWDGTSMKRSKPGAYDTMFQHGGFTKVPVEQHMDRYGINLYQQGGQFVQTPVPQHMDRYGLNLYQKGGFVDVPLPQKMDRYGLNLYGDGGIHIKPENKGKFTSWAQSHGMSVQEAASKVMANKEDYSSTVVKRANFAKNFGGKHQYGGSKMAAGGYSPYTPGVDNETQVPQLTPPAPVNDPTGLDPANYAYNTMGNSAAQTGVVAPQQMPAPEPWKAGMTDDQAMQNLNNRPSTTDYMAQTQPPQQPRAPRGQGYRDILGAAMIYGQYAANNRQNKNLQAYQIQQGMTSMNPTQTPFNKGVYNQQGQVTGMAKMGGQMGMGGKCYEAGGQYEMDDMEIEMLRKKGYTYKMI
jgi:hypothetical protein